MKIILIICLTVWAIATEKIVADFIIADDASQFLQRSIQQHFMIPRLNVPDRDKNKSDNKL